MNKKERMYNNIKKHGENLQAIFGLEGDPVKLYKQLRRLEMKSNHFMVQYCNGEIDYNEVENFILTKIKPALQKILGQDCLDYIYINQDPRGYTLKLNKIASERNRSLHQDWGGYGILAPD